MAGATVTLIEGDANTVDIPGPPRCSTGLLRARDPQFARRCSPSPGLAFARRQTCSIRRETRPRPPGSAVQFLFPGEVQDLAMGGRQARHPQDARQRPAVCRPGSRRPQPGALGLYVRLRLRGTGNQGVPNPWACATSVELIAGTLPAFRLWDNV